MRLYVRRAGAGADTDTDLLGYPVYKGRIVAVSIWGVHHRPTVWPDPFAFSRSARSSP